MIADDHDRWVHKIPESPEWALAVQTLGGISSYREILKLREPQMSRKLRSAFESGQDAMRRSLELAQATMIDRKLDNGITVRTACCFGYSSEVAAQLYKGRLAPSSRCSTCAARASACGAAPTATSICPSSHKSTAAEVMRQLRASRYPTCAAFQPSGSQKFWATSSKSQLPDPRARLHLAAFCLHFSTAFPLRQI